MLHIDGNVWCVITICPHAPFLDFAELFVINTLENGEHTV